MTDKLIGTAPYQVPSNADLGDTAYQDASYVNIGGSAKFDQLTAENTNLVATDKPNIEPSLLLDFANSETVDSRITFTRDSIATRTNRFGLIETVDWNVPRIDYDPVTGECKGFLIEEARTNLMLDSNISASNSNAIYGWFCNTTEMSLSSEITPFGTAANFIKETITPNVSGFQVYQRKLSVPINTIRTFSIFFKAGTRSKVEMHLTTGGYINSVYATVDLNNGTISSATVIGTAVVSSPSTITPYKNGWYRCTVSGIHDATATDVYAAIRLLNDAGEWNYTGDDTSGVYVFGGQVEEGAFATSYIPTSGTAVTRESDFPSIPLSTWFNATEGTMYSEFSTVDTDNFGVFYAGTATAGTPHLTKVVVTGGLYGACFGDAGSNTLNNTVTFPGTAKAAYAYKSGDSAVAVNSTVVTNADTSVFAANSPAYIGCRGGDSLFQLNGHMKKLTYYPKRVTNTELQALTRI